MKEIQIKKDFDRSYLLIEGDEIENNYVFNMITKNKILGLLECKPHYIEDKFYCAYDVTSKKTLEQEYADKKMKFSDLMDLFYGINTSISQARGYLLGDEGFLLEPQYIYIDLETQQLECLYYPKTETDTSGKRNTYRQLADFLLDKIDHRDEHAVNITYHFYKISKEEFFSFETFVRFMEKESLLAGAKERRQKEKPELEEVSENAMGNKIMHSGEDEMVCLGIEEEGKDEGNPNWKVPAVMFISGAVFTGIYLLFPAIKTFAAFLLIPGLTCIVWAIVLVIRNGILLYKQSKEPIYMESENAVRVEEYFDDMLDDVTVFFDQETSIHLKWKEGRFSKDYVLDTLPVTVGKLKERVQMVINDPSISRLHARFHKKGDTLYLQDLDSTNGTFVNGKQLITGEEAIIKSGDEIQFGKIIVNVV